MPKSMTNQTRFFTSLLQQNSMIKPLVAKARLYCMAMFCLGCSSAYAGSPESPSDTKITDNFSPLGIDQPKPKFAWILHDKERGQFQTAYQIMVVTAVTILKMRITSSGIAASSFQTCNMELLTAVSHYAQRQNTGGK